MKKCLDPCSIGILDRQQNDEKESVRSSCLDPCSIGILDRPDKGIFYGSFNSNVLIPALLEY